MKEIKSLYGIEHNTFKRQYCGDLHKKVSVLKEERINENRLKNNLWTVGKIARKTFYSLYLNEIVRTDTLIKVLKLYSRNT